MPCYRRAIELAPNFADAWNNLAPASGPEKTRGKRRMPIARRWRSNRRSGNPQQPGVVPERPGSPGRSAGEPAAFAGDRDAQRQDVALNGTLLLDLDRVDEAAAAAERGLALEPANHDIVNMMGRIAFERHDHAGAEAWYRRALELKPDLSDALNNLGNALKEKGKLDEARAAFVKSLSSTRCLGRLCQLRGFGEIPADNPHLKLMQAIAGQHALSDTDRMQLDFALGKAYADIKDHARSFEHLLSGNALKRAQIQYDETATLGLFDRIEAVFTRS